MVALIFQQLRGRFEFSNTLIFRFTSYKRSRIRLLMSLQDLPVIYSRISDFLKSKGLSDNALHDCFPLSRDMTAVSTRLATMTVIATLGPEGPLGLKTPPLHSDVLKKTINCIFQINCLLLPGLQVARSPGY